MATLYIAEIELLGLDAHGAEIMAPKMPPIAEQTVAIGMTTAASTNAFTTRTRFVQIHTDAVCSIAFGVAPVATTSNQRLAANETRFVTVNAGDKVAVIVNT
jgi:hypothetical protein